MVFGTKQSREIMRLTQQENFNLQNLGNAISCTLAGFVCAVIDDVNTLNGNYFDCPPYTS